MFTFNGAALRRARKPRLARIENRLTRIENRLMVNLQWGRAQTSAETSIKGWKLHVRIAYLQWGRAQTSAETWLIDCEPAAPCLPSMGPRSDERGNGGTGGSDPQDFPTFNGAAL